MNAIFYTSAAIAIFSTIMAIMRRHAIHALLNLIISLLAVAVVIFTLGAPFMAALEIIIYAGAIMVVFVFAVMLLNPDDRTTTPLRLKTWIVPAIFAVILLAELVYLLSAPGSKPLRQHAINPRQVGVTLFGPYLLGVELASLLLLSGLIGAFHLGRHRGPNKGGD
jgi:NADH-quinone oxidoreductase subunit J